MESVKGEDSPSEEWVTATNIAVRIRDLRKALSGGLTQRQLAVRAGVSGKQVSKWEKGNQVPAQPRLSSWAEREGWPIAIFTEGGPMPASVVNGPVIKRAGEVRERDATYEVGSPTGEPVAPEGNDPIQEIRATEATGILERGAKAADKLLNLGRLDDAVTTLWRIIGAAQRELRDGGMEDDGPASPRAPGPDPKTKASLAGAWKEIEKQKEGNGQESN